MQRCDWRSQVVRNVSDELASQVVGLLERTKLRHNAIRHLFEGCAQTTNFILTFYIDGLKQLGRIRAVILKSHHRRGQTGQPAGQQIEQDQPGNKAEKQTRCSSPSTQAQNVAALQQLRDRLVLLSRKHDVEIALGAFCRHNRRCREDLSPARVAWVVAQNRQCRGASKKAAHRFQGDLLSLYLSWRCRERDNVPLAV